MSATPIPRTLEMAITGIREMSTITTPPRDWSPGHPSIYPDPDVIVVGGGAAAGTGDLLLDPARVAMTERVIGHHRRTIAPVLPARLGYDAGLIGAAALARTLV